MTLKPQLVLATLDDYPTIQNMARFYVYDLSRNCGRGSDDWAMPSDGLYESFDFKSYFEEANSKAFLIKVENELAGFILLNKEAISPNVDWNMGEFFILARFQGQGIGQLITHELWNSHLGYWEVSVIPENKSALAFWRQTIADFTRGSYTEVEKDINYDEYQPKRVILNFDTQNKCIQDGEQKKGVSIAFVEQLDEELKEYMTNDLIAYERNHGIDINYKSFSLVLSNEVNEVCGVINAFTAFAEIYIDDIWVDAKYRGKGYGRQLVDALEQHFKGQGFNNINLCTSAFQAPEFYKKCGFQEEFKRINKNNPKLTKSFFVKFFGEGQETQGVHKALIEE